MYERRMLDGMHKSCYLCGSSKHLKRPGKVRDDAGLEIYECCECGLVFLSRGEHSPYFYERGGMHGGEPQPIEEWLRETDWDDERRFRYLSQQLTNRDVLDFGCGAGGFLFKARAKARYVMGIELEKRLHEHFKNNGLDVVQSIKEIAPDQRFDLITAFHVIEHLQDPAATLKQLATRLRGKGEIVIEIPSSADALLTLYESAPFSEFTYWSCHLYLFNASNLPLLAKRAGLRLKYIRHIQRYPLSNHLYWLAKGKPGGHQIWGFLDSKELSTAYEAQLAAIGKTDTLIASLTI